MKDGDRALCFAGRSTVLLLCCFCSRLKVRGVVGVTGSERFFTGLTACNVNELTMPAVIIDPKLA